MAITGNYTTNDGVNHPNAYLRIATIGPVNWSSKTADVQITMYHDETCRNQGKDEIYSNIEVITATDFDNVFDDTVLNTNGINPRKSVYDNYLKLQPDYTGWLDI